MELQIVRNQLNSESQNRKIQSLEKINYNLKLNFEESEKIWNATKEKLLSEKRELSEELGDALKLIDLMESQKSIKSSISNLGSSDFSSLLNWSEKLKKKRLREFLFTLISLSANYTSNKVDHNCSLNFCEFKILRSQYKQLKAMNISQENLEVRSNQAKTNLLIKLCNILLGMDIKNKNDVSFLLENNFIETFWKKIINLLSLAINVENEGGRGNVQLKNNFMRDNNQKSRLSKLSLIKGPQKNPGHPKKDISLFNDSFKNEIQGLLSDDKKESFLSEHNIPNNIAMEIMEMKLLLEEEIEKNELLQSEMLRIREESENVANQIASENILAEKEHIKTAVYQLLINIPRGSKDTSKYLILLSKALQLSNTEKTDITFWR